MFLVSRGIPTRVCAVLIVLLIRLIPLSISLGAHRHLNLCSEKLRQSERTEG
jgi:hypothetical protein